MMGFSVLFIFALLQICTLCDGGNSEDLSNITDPSNHHHHLHPRAETNDQNIVDLKTNLKLVDSDLIQPEDAILFSINDKNYHISITGKCKEIHVDVNSDKVIKAAKKEGRKFIVNKDNFEILEWKTWEEIMTGKIPCLVLMICKSYYITKDKNGNPKVTKDNKNMQTEVLSLNYDIKGQRLQIDDYVVKEQIISERVAVIKQFTAENKNCDKAKHVVNLDQGSDKTRSFLKGDTVSSGKAIEASISGKIVTVVQIGGKRTIKYDQSHLNSETTSKLDKVLHSVSMEIEVAPNCSCTIEIKSKTFEAEVPYSGQLIRQYKNGDARTISVTGIYNHQEVAELLTSVNPCTPLTDGVKCSNAQPV